METRGIPLAGAKFSEDAWFAWGSKIIDQIDVRATEENRKEKLREVVAYDFSASETSFQRKHVFFLEIKNFSVHEHVIFNLKRTVSSQVN